MTDVTLYCGDCLNYMATMEDDSVDLVVTDPPYNVGIDYGVANDNKPHDKYLRFIEASVNEYKRVAGGRVAIVLGSKVVKYWWDFLPDAKQIIVRTGAAINAKWRNMTLKYYSILCTETSRISSIDLWEDIRFPSEGYFFREDRYEHPAVAPLSLMTRLISYFSDSGQTIYDPFMGTGTTCVAAVNLGRIPIGSEINPDYFAIAEKRIKEAQMQLRLGI